MIEKNKIAFGIVIFLIHIMFIVALIPLLSSQELNNKVYDDVLKKVSVKDKDGVLISEVTLLTPNPNSVIRGKNRKVAEFLIVNSKDDYKDPFKSMEFIDLKLDKTINRNFKLKIKVQTDVREVKEYNRTCIGFIDEKKKLPYCIKIQNGSHFEPVYEWREIDYSNGMPQGSYNVGVFVDVLPREKVELIPTWFNVEMTEYTEWNENLEEGLIAYWNFNESTGTDAFDYYGRYNLTVDGNLWTDGGLIGSARNTSNNDDENTGINTTSWNEITILVWTKQESNSGSEYFAGNTVQGSEGNGNYLMIFSNQNHISYYWYNGGTSTITTGHPANQWIMNTLCVNITSGVANGKFAHHFQNDTLVQADNFTNSNPFLGFNFNLFAGVGGGNPIDDVIIDEIGIWDRCLSIDDVEHLYNNGAGLTPVDLADVELPNVTLQLPVQDFNLTSENITFTCNVSDNVAVINVSLWINGSLNHTIFNSTSNTDINFTYNVTLDEGIFSWTCQGTDSNNNIGWALNNRSLNYTWVNLTIEDDSGGILTLDLDENYNIILFVVFIVVAFVLFYLGIVMLSGFILLVLGVILIVNQYNVLLGIFLMLIAVFFLTTERGDQ